MAKKTCSTNVERDIEWRAFCWQEKNILRLIQEGKFWSVKCSIAVYTVLTQLASNYQSENIEVYWLKIIEMSWVWRDSLRTVLNNFHDFWIIRLKKWKLKHSSENIHSKMNIVLLGFETTIIWKQGKKQEDNQGNKSLSIEESNRKNNKEENNRIFEIFWNIYPRKISKKESKELFFKLSEKDQQAAVAWSRGYVDMLTRTNKMKYAQSPVKWIIWEKWNDDNKWELYFQAQNWINPINWEPW